MQVSDVQKVTTITAGRKFVLVTINGIPTTLQLDTGSDITLLSRKTWENIGRPTLRPTSASPVDAQAKSIPLLGQATLSCQLGESSKTLVACIAEIAHDLLGIDWIDKFGLWQIPAVEFCNNIQKCSPFNAELATSSIKREFAEVFQSSMGCCPLIKGHLTLKANAQTIFRPSRNVPFPLMPRVDEELERLEQSGIITPVQFSQFAAPIVIVKKSTGAIRICGDYSTGLNDQLESNHYPVPSTEHIFSDMARATVFSKVDLSDAYLQLEMDDESKALLTINTHKGLYTFNRLCPGVKPACAIFQEAVDKALAGIPDARSYFDDILIKSTNMHDHLHTIRLVLTRLKEFNLRAKPEKCEFFKTEIRYLGLIIDEHGQRPDPDKTRAIAEMPSPTNTSELRSFLGAVGFYIKFIPSMSDVRAPLDRMMKKDVQFTWGEECEAAVKRFREILTSNLVLCHYDSDRRVTIASDASQVGIGGLAFHKDEDGAIKVFHYASRRLTDTETRYSQIEKEALGIVYAVERFRDYVLGRNFTLQTDHKPLLAIYGSSKGVPGHVANRLRRWALTLSAYDFNMEFVGTKEFGYADVLSRLIRQSKDNGDLVIAEIEAEQQATQMVQHATNTFLPVTFEDIGRETENDATLTQVLHYVQHGWPPAQHHIKDREVAKFFRLRESLSSIKSCLIYRDRTVIPPSQHKAVLRQLHSGHQGMVRMKALARYYAYWPGIDEHIETVVRGCNECARSAKAPIKVPLRSWPTPTGPWERVHADFAGPITGFSYFILVDAYSKWPEVYKMTQTTTKVTLAAITDCCTRWGMMTTLVTDNGPQFTSALFQQYCKDHTITHLTSPPYHPSSNGLAERFVDTFKRALEKSQGTDEEVKEYLGIYRATPHANAQGGLSPAELMYGRRLRLPLAGILPPAQPSSQRNERMEECYNRRHGAKNREFNKGEEIHVRIGPRGEWVPGVVAEHESDVIYRVTTSRGSVRAHTNQLRRRDPLPLDFLTDYSTTEDAREAAPRRKSNRRKPNRTSPPLLRPRPLKRPRLQ